MPPHFLWFPLFATVLKVCVISYPICLCPAILFPVMLLWRIYILLTERAQIGVLRAWIMFEHSMYQKSIPFPCSLVVVHLWSPSEASLSVFERNFFPGWGCYHQAQPPTWMTVVSLFVWVITFDRSGLSDPVSSYTTAGFVLRIIWPPRLHHCAKVGTLSGRTFSFRKEKFGPNVLVIRTFYIGRFLEIVLRKFKIY